LHRRTLISLAIAAVAAGSFAVMPAAASSSTNIRSISASGTASLSDGALDGAALGTPEIATGVGDTNGAATAGAPSVPVNRSKSAGKEQRGSSSGESDKDETNASLLVSFDGLRHYQQRYANGGNQFSVEPPDQGLCVGNGFVFETVNDVLAVYDQAGATKKGPTALNSFYGYVPAINRATGVRGPFVTDPSCLYDSATQRWFHVTLTLEVNPANGHFLGPNHLDIAVSKTADPTQGWVVYSVPVQDDGSQGTPDHHCSLKADGTGHGACIGDYPHIGADANGFYVTTNEYSLFGPEYKAAQVYAFSKQALAANAASVLLTQIDTTNMVHHKQAGFTVWPATAANGAFNTEADGTEFFMSSNAADEVNPLLNRTSRDLVVWALTNTASLNSGSPDVELTNTVLRVGRYSVPAPSNQKTGSTPLLDCINDTTIGCWQALFTKEPAHNEVMAHLDSNDTRMQQVVYANGTLYGALDTALTIGGKSQAGIEWFAAQPSVTGGKVHAHVANQGYLGLADTNLNYPAIAVNSQGVGAMSFTLVGTNDYPSAAYVLFNGESGPGAIHYAAHGAGPDDGFTGYVAYVGDPPRPRWGDYGAAVVDGSKIWMASEYIGQTCTFQQWLTMGPKFGSCGGARSALANWDTRITALALGGD
jgi:hypothetical protein